MTTCGYKVSDSGTGFNTTPCLKQGCARKFGLSSRSESHLDSAKPALCATVSITCKTVIISAEQHFAVYAQRTISEHSPYSVAMSNSQSKFFLPKQTVTLFLYFAYRSEIE